MNSKGAFRLERKLSRDLASLARQSLRRVTLPARFISQRPVKGIRKKKCPIVLALLFTQERSVDNKRVSRQQVSKCRVLNSSAFGILRNFVYLPLSELNSNFIFGVQIGRNNTHGLNFLGSCYLFSWGKKISSTFFFFNFRVSAHIWLRRQCHFWVTFI